jgi:hypothetical protein
MSNEVLVRLDLGGGWCVEQDMPPPKLRGAVRRLNALAQANKPPTRTKDVLAVNAVMKWLDDQHVKHGGVKPCGEGPCGKTITMSPETKAVFKNARLKGLCALSAVIKWLDDQPS